MHGNILVLSGQLTCISLLGKLKISWLNLLDLEMEDCCVWTTSNDGIFSIKSAWDLCKVKCSYLGLDKIDDVAS